MAETRTVHYVFDKQLRDATSRIPNIKIRSAVVHSLIKAYKLLPQCIVTSIVPASEDQLLTFHSRNYIEHLQKAQSSQDLEKVEETNDNVEFNLEYDCPLFENIYDFTRVIAGGTLTATALLCPKEVVATCRKMNVNAIQDPKSYLRFKERQNLKHLQEDNRSENIKDMAKDDVYDIPGDLSMDEDALLTSSLTPCKENRPARVFQTESSRAIYGPQLVAINWFGGWHHAQRDAAEGFCYVNDIVIGIQHLLKYYKRILYVDLDIHHGNGVENAFSHTAHVMTLSFHRYGPGYYPGTGSIDEIGLGPGKYYTINVPLKDGITDQPYFNLFSQVTDKVQKVYQPDCLVIQCGADCLSGDPLGGFNLTLNGIGNCVERLLSWKLPTVLLGGGGYNIANAARCFAYLTSVALGNPISNDIPDNDFFHLFGPGFELAITPSLRKDENTATYLEDVSTTVLKNLDNLPPITSAN